MIHILEEYSKDCVPEVAETCQLALCRLQWLQSINDTTNLERSPYMSVDPAPPADIEDVKKLKEILLNENISLFERYKAMFALRNIHTPESILALSDGKYNNNFVILVLYFYYLQFLLICHFKNIM